MNVSFGGIYYIKSGDDRLYKLLNKQDNYLKQNNYLFKNEESTTISDDKGTLILTGKESKEFNEIKTFIHEYAKANEDATELYGVQKYRSFEALLDGYKQKAITIDLTNVPLKNY